jgi:hypothetical protein
MVGRMARATLREVVTLVILPFALAAGATATAVLRLWGRGWSGLIILLGGVVAGAVGVAALQRMGRRRPEAVERRGFEFNVALLVVIGSVPFWSIFGPLSKERFLLLVPGSSPRSGR